jgi:hypothetical protein
MDIHEVVIEGTNFLLLHKYSVASVSDPKTRVINVKDSVNYKDEWKKATYLNEKGFVVMPQLNLMACIFDGAKGMKAGKKALTRTIYTSLKVTPFEPEILCLVPGEKELRPITLKDIEDNLWLNVTGAVVGKARVDRVRTYLPIGWRIKFSIIVKEDTLDLRQVKGILDHAGTESGLGDWRPSAPKKPGPYGTFRVTSFDGIEYDEEGMPIPKK